MIDGNKRYHHPSHHRRISGLRLSGLVAALILLISACDSRQSAYHSGPVGPVDPSVPSVEEGTASFQRAGQKPGNVASKPKAGAGRDASVEFPPRETIQRQKPAETFSSAVGGDSAAPDGPVNSESATEKQRRR